jgi:hypothetical protein
LCIEIEESPFGTLKLPVSFIICLSQIIKLGFSDICSESGFLKIKSGIPGGRGKFWSLLSGFSKMLLEFCFLCSDGSLSLFLESLDGLDELLEFSLFGILIEELDFVLLKELLSEISWWGIRGILLVECLSISNLLLQIFESLLVFCKSFELLSLFLLTSILFLVGKVIKVHLILVLLLLKLVEIVVDVFSLIAQFFEEVPHISELFIISLELLSINIWHVHLVLDVVD